MNESQEPPGLPYQPPQSSTSPSGSKKHTILVVEKDAVSRYLSKELLQFNGHWIHTAESCQKALEVYAHHRETISLLLFDAVCVMEEPELFVETMRQKNPSVIIVMTATAQEIKKIGMLVEEFAVQMLMKPYNGRKLLSFIENCR